MSQDSTWKSIHTLKPLAAITIRKSRLRKKSSLRVLPRNAGDGGRFLLLTLLSRFCLPGIAYENVLYQQNYTAQKHVLHEKVKTVKLLLKRLNVFADGLLAIPRADNRIAVWLSIPKLQNNRLPWNGFVCRQ